MSDFFICSTESENKLESILSERLTRDIIPTIKSGLGSSRLILEIDPSSDLIYRLIVIEPIGNRNEYVMKNFRENVRISDRQFIFKLPKDVQVMSQ